MSKCHERYLLCKSFQDIYIWYIVCISKNRHFCSKSMLMSVSAITCHNCTPALLPALPGMPGCKNIKAGGDNVMPPSDSSGEGKCCTYVVYRSFRYPPPVPPIQPLIVRSCARWQGCVRVCASECIPSGFNFNLYSGMCAEHIRWLNPGCAENELWPLYVLIIGHCWTLMFAFASIKEWCARLIITWTARLARFYIENGLWNIYRDTHYMVAWNTRAHFLIIFVLLRSA